MKPYKPIACALYDEFEAAAVKKTINTITYVHEEQSFTIHGRIIDFKTKNKEEFMILEDQTMIRLDKIVTFNGINTITYENCQVF